jgi:hypothetical protein
MVSTVNVTGKRTAKKELFAAPFFLEADGNAISREKVKDNATFVVPPIVAAKVGDTLEIYSPAEDGVWYSDLELEEEHLGKSLGFTVLAFHFEVTQWVEAYYILKQKDGSLISDVSRYEVTD